MWPIILNNVADVRGIHVHCTNGNISDTVQDRTLSL